MDKRCNEKETLSQSVNFIQKLIKNELDKLSKFMFANGLTVLSEQSHMMHLSSGCSLKSSFLLDIQSKNVETSKISWNSHLEYMLTDAKRR